ncbi:MAG: questin oxidase family protein [Chloroflexi bacterium]|nr:questin oxidase family protein [Chloroflexota bacterium]
MGAVIDEVLDLLKDTAPEFRGGLSNHGPMAAEALFALDRGEQALSWAEGYMTRLEPRLPHRAVISETNWLEALGDYGRVSDWIAFFDRQLADVAWRTVVAKWVPRLVPGIFAGAMHGVIRSGHAVRSLSAEETSVRLHELAQGLGYWASRYQTLPGELAGGGEWWPSQAIQHVGMLPASLQPHSGLITHRVRALDRFPPFSDVINLVDIHIHSSDFISDLTVTAARACLFSVPHFGNAIAYVHALTGPRMLRIIAPYLADEDVGLALAYGWQAAAGIWATYGYESDDTVPPDLNDANTEDLIDQAVATADEHAIKFTEACLSEGDLTPSSLYLASAWDVARRLK